MILLCWCNNVNIVIVDVVTRIVWDEWKLQKDFKVLPSNIGLWRAFEATQEIQKLPVGTGDRWKSLPEIDKSSEKMEMEWIAEAIENDWKFTERRFVEVVDQNCARSEGK